NENHIYFSTAEADPHRILAPKATHPRTAVDILSQILRRDGAQVSAHSAAAAESDPFTRLHAAAAMYSDALTAAAEHTVGAATMAHIDAAAVAIRANITDCGAWPVLRRNLALLAVDGHDPIEALHTAAAPLGNPIDVAAVLDWRLQPPPGSTAERMLRHAATRSRHAATSRLSPPRIAVSAAVAASTIGRLVSSRVRRRPCLGTSRPL